MKKYKANESVLFVTHHVSLYIVILLKRKSK